MIGHQTQLQFFQNAIEQGRLSHAYLLVGPRHVGKTTLAQTVAAELLATDVAHVAVHPDMRMVRQSTNEKTGKLRKDISIDQIRGIRSFAAAGPVVGEHSVILIEDADLLSRQAANGLLKTLEEPHTKTTIFLTTTDVRLLPATIVSRSQQIYLPPVPDDHIIAAIDHPDAAAIVAAAQGLPGLAQRYASDSDAWEGYQETKKLWDAMLNQPLFQKRATIASLLDSKDDHIAGRARLIETMQIWQQLIPQTQLPSLQQVEMYDILTTAQQQLRQNIHPRAVMDTVLLTLP